MNEDYFGIYVDMIHDFTDLDWKILELLKERPSLRFKSIVNAVGDVDDADDTINYLRDIGAITEGPLWSITKYGRILLKLHCQMRSG